MYLTGKLLRCLQSRRAVPAALGLAVVFGSAAMAATPTPYLQDLTIVGSGGTLTATDVPVETSTGSLVYKDVTIELSAATNGNLTIASGYPKVVAATNPILDNFVAGSYTAPATLASKLLVSVARPELARADQPPGRSRRRAEQIVEPIPLRRRGTPDRLPATLWLPGSRRSASPRASIATAWSGLARLAPSTAIVTSSPER